MRNISSILKLPVHLRHKNIKCHHSSDMMIFIFKNIFFGGLILSALYWNSTVPTNLVVKGTILIAFIKNVSRDTHSPFVSWFLSGRSENVAWRSCFPPATWQPAAWKRPSSQNLIEFAIIFYLDFKANKPRLRIISKLRTSPKTPSLSSNVL